MIARLGAVAVLALLLSGCVEADTDAATADACGAGKLAYLVGQPSRVLDRMTFTGPVRIIRPGMAVTMDYNPGRLNILIGINGRIERVYCA